MQASKETETSVVVEKAESLETVKSRLGSKDASQAFHVGDPSEGSLQSAMGSGPQMMPTMATIEGTYAFEPETSNFVVSSAESPNQQFARSTETYSEEYQENESGLSHGIKKAHDGSWEERWLQQKLETKKPAEEVGEVQDVQVLFGRSIGTDRQLAQRWTAAWKHEIPLGSGATIKTVKKTVEKYDGADSEQKLEEWHEMIHEEFRSSETSDPQYRRQSEKRGVDHTNQRTWKEICVETGNSSSESEHRQVHVHFEEESKATGFRRSRDLDTKPSGDSVTTTTTTYSPPSGPGTEPSEGANSILKKTVVETRRAGTDEIVATAEDILLASGTEQSVVTEHLEEGTVHVKRRQTEFHPGTSQPHTVLIEETWTKADGDAWGTQKRLIYAPESEQLEEEHHEKWYNNLSEKFKDTWSLHYAYDDTGRVVSTTLSGRKHGDRYSDGTEWGETWCRTYKPYEDKVECPESEHGQLQSYEYDKWWREPSGNRWGIKKRADINSEVEQNEKWYDNGEELQVDRWQSESDKIKFGEKFGEKKDGHCRWSEKWSQEATDYRIEKSWTEWKSEHLSKWGEIKGKEGERVWEETWAEDKAVKGDSGSWRSNKWSDDGLGNSTTLKEGTEWREGVVMNWYQDKYGECLGHSEKWAYKQGKNDQGDVWVEKWNETPHEKSAVKEGSNA